MEVAMVIKKADNSCLNLHINNINTKLNPDCTVVVYWCCTV